MTFLPELEGKFHLYLEDAMNYGKFNAGHTIETILRTDAADSLTKLSETLEVHECNFKLLLEDHDFYAYLSDLMMDISDDFRLSAGDTEFSPALLKRGINVPLTGISIQTVYNAYTAK